MCWWLLAQSVEECECACRQEWGLTPGCLPRSAAWHPLCSPLWMSYRSVPWRVCMSVPVVVFGGCCCCREAAHPGSHALLHLLAAPCCTPCQGGWLFTLAVCLRLTAAVLPHVHLGIITTQVWCMPTSLMQRCWA
jgi:hypothetical protein